MSAQPHLETFNSSQAIQNEELTFHPFPRLPTELRSKIWRHSLQRRRLIHIRLKDQGGRTATQAGENPECTSNGECYFTVIQGSQLLSKLLRVNSESRGETLMFHRVHLPCRFTSGSKDQRTAHGTFHFNPEWDFLRIRAESPADDTMVQFLYRLKIIHDPRHVGLLNLAMDRIDLHNMHVRYSKFSVFESEVRSAFIETLTQLTQVWFVSCPLRKRGRVVFSNVVNSSMPIITTSPTFDLLHRDPRSIGQDLRRPLKKVISNYGINSWLRLLKNWHTSPPRIEYQFLIAYEPRMEGDQVHDDMSAKMWLQKEEDRCNERSPDAGSLKHKQGERPVCAGGESYRNEDLENAVKPAFGFWLFPLAALGAINENGFFEIRDDPSGRTLPKDITEYWPELALSRLS